jgi:predicted enzyme related to lactoylglutathione lyase
VTTPFVCHVEWGTPDPDSLQKFLNQLFGWKFQAFTPEYLMYMPADGGVSIGVRKSDQVRAGGSPNASVRVNDIDDVMAKVESLGGKVVVLRTQMGTGAFAFIAGPDGNLIGLQMI